MIRLDDVRKTFQAGRANEWSAIRGVTLMLEPGRATVIKGPSGSGKTTLLSLVGGMARPTSGRIWLYGREITSLPERFLTEIRRKTFGFIFQHLNLIRGVTGLENAMLPAYPVGEPHAKIRKRAMDLFSLFEIAPRAQTKAEQLSGGEAQRVAIVRALMNDPSIIIADEPTAHLDTQLSLDFLTIMGELKKAGKTLVLASHDPVVYQSSLVDRVVSLRDGRLDGDAG
jgi:putative ABC transport system ATP-binding protein